MHNNLFIGINSGTSLDQIDCGLFSFEDNKTETLGTHSIAFPPELSNTLRNLSSNSEHKFTLMGLGDSQTKLAMLYGKASQALLEQHNIDKNMVTAIGCHGQTVYHSPVSEPAYTYQLNNGAVIAHITGIDTVTDFRSADMAANGQGAPLAPAFHAKFFSRSAKPTAIVNLGGIANITLLLPNEDIIGFDTGPANCLMDMWVQKNFDLTLDYNGDIAKSGKIIIGLLNDLLADAYFNRSHPKSTGVDYFNLHWLEQYLKDQYHSPKDIMATLCELTAISIANEIQQSSTRIESVYLCGGGTNNLHLLNRIQSHLSNTPIFTTSEFGVDPNWVECALFAWLAKMNIDKQVINLSSITGSTHPIILGAYYPAVK
ncbi:anhydro-N-acetylmuramic acid kinase [Francisellaceae bacterium]|nr:anhydro-N-acetylmuramic acid kinase [Francisellaceae bacterium]